MQIGKLPNELLEKLIINPIIKNKRNKDIILRPKVGEDCAAVSFGDEIMTITTDPITATGEDIGSLLLHICCNDIAASGATPIGILITILMPEDCTQKQLEDILNSAANTADKLNVEIIGGHTEVTTAVNRPVVIGTAIGKISDGYITSSSNAKIGQDIVLTKWAGIEGTVILAKEYRNELIMHFSKERAHLNDNFKLNCENDNSFAHKVLDNALNLESYLSVLNEAKIGKQNGATAMHDATEGGVLGACLEVAMSSNVCVNIDISKIPVKDITVDICKYFDINPYRLIASGSLIITSHDGERLVNVLKENNINSAVIGKITNDENIIIDLDGKIKPLEQMSKDELYNAKTKIEQ